MKVTRNSASEASPPKAAGGAVRRRRSCGGQGPPGTQASPPKAAGGAVRRRRSCGGQGPPVTQSHVAHRRFHGRERSEPAEGGGGSGSPKAKPRGAKAPRFWIASSPKAAGGAVRRRRSRGGQGPPGTQAHRLFWIANFLHGPALGGERAVRVGGAAPAARPRRDGEPRERQPCAPGVDETASFELNECCLDVVDRCAEQQRETSLARRTRAASLDEQGAE